MESFRLVDACVIALYLVAMIVLGKVAVRSAATSDGFFLAGRKLGKLYQFFLNFGHSTSATAAVSTASIVYQQGVSGAWAAFQLVFLNPYYWFMHLWFRRVRLTTMSDLFFDRLGSRRLGWLYACFQIVMTIGITIGFTNLVSYKICSALILKPEARWTAAERQSVEDYRDLERLETSQRQGRLAAGEQERLALLRERQVRGELNSYITALKPWTFHIGYMLVAGFYIVAGGMRATALADACQGVLIVVFSSLLILPGIAALGGWRQLGALIPPDRFLLFGTPESSDFTGWTVAAAVLMTLVANHAVTGNMGLAGSARSEAAAQFGGVAGTFGKRLMTILWAFCGLIAIALYPGSRTLADADLVWGTMSRQLLGPGLLGLMVASALAATMATVASNAIAASALFSKNVYAAARTSTSDHEIVIVARVALVVILVLGTIVSVQLNSVYIVLQFGMTMNVPFGAAILLMFIWRKVTAAGVWIGVLTAAGINIVFPLVAQNIPALAHEPALVARARSVEGGPEKAVYFENVVRTRVDDPTSGFEGRGRLHTELLLVRALGVDIVKMSPGGRMASRFLIDALLPIAAVILASLGTRRVERDRVEQFFGKMKTPVALDPALDTAEMEKTRAAPARFDHLKLWPDSSWEFTRWNSADARGFTISCGITLAIVGLFCGLLQLASPH